MALYKAAHQLLNLDHGGTVGPVPLSIVGVFKGLDKQASIAPHHLSLLSLEPKSCRCFLFAPSTLYEKSTGRGKNLGKTAFEILTLRKNGIGIWKRHGQWSAKGP